MGQVTATPPGVMPPAEPQNGIVTQAERARNQALVAAVRALNQAGFAGSSREITYSTDSSTRQLVIRVVDRQSGDVIVQWPSEYALQMAQEYLKEHPNNESLL